MTEKLARRDADLKSMLSTQTGTAAESAQLRATLTERDREVAEWSRRWEAAQKTSGAAADAASDAARTLRTELGDTKRALDAAQSQNQRLSAQAAAHEETIAALRASDKAQRVRWLSLAHPRGTQQRVDRQIECAVWC